MKILFVLNQLPYPPRNGSTIPSYNYLTGLAKSNEVSLLFVSDLIHQSSLQDLESNRQLVSGFWVTQARKKPTIRRVVNEIAGRSFYHMGRDYDEDYIASIFRDHTFDAVWISDEGIIDILHLLRVYSGDATRYIIGLHDCITAVFRQSAQHVLSKGGSLTERLKAGIKWLRSFRAGAIENRILQHYDLIQVQSEADRSLLNRLSSGKLNSKIMVLSNGVDSSVFANEVAHQNSNLLFVGSLSGYGKIVQWLLDEVWPAVKARHPEAVFYVFGKGAPVKLKAAMQRSNDVVHIEYTENLREVYQDKTVSVSPVFKQYGLINKVVESMAAGVPVVADRGAFSNIPEFIEGTHGLIANTPTEMATAINTLLESREVRERIGNASRLLMMKHFQWRDRIDGINEQLSARVPG